MWQHAHNSSRTSVLSSCLLLLLREQVPPSHDLLAHAADVVRAWACLGGHPGLCVPRAAFASPEPAALWVAHDFKAGAATLEAARLQPQVAANGLVQACLQCLC